VTPSVPLRLLFPALLLVAVLGLPVSAEVEVPPSTAGTGKNFELVGHDPLMDRGMNAAPAIFEDYLYVGNRTDGSPHHLNPGVLVVDISDPSAPEVVGEIGTPDEGLRGQTSRELRVWPEQKLLLVLNFGCSAIIHACVSTAEFGGEPFNITFFDLTDPANPELVATYEPSRQPHEIFLWEDPKDPKRALLFMSTPTGALSIANLVVADISGARDGEFQEIAEFTANDLFSQASRDTYDVRMHSMAVSPDGTRTYLSYLGGGFILLDSTGLVKATKPPFRILSPPKASPRWDNMTVHSALPVPGEDLVITTDELYGDLLNAGGTGAFGPNIHGCPWGWLHVINVSNEKKPKLVGEFRVAENEDAFCAAGAGGSVPETDTFRSYAAHNPTLVGNLAFVTWHSGGLRALQITEKKVTQLGFFVPEPLTLVGTEDPALSFGVMTATKTVMWSYPIIKDGLIYVVDVRNGLYVLRYTGPQASKVAAIDFLEGNSNLGDAFRLDR
jgi:hypothetical protein